ncbi:MAG: PAS domain S-box protein [bacterium]|nr:PAS domain S-box protein [bacterium]
MHRLLKRQLKKLFGDTIPQQEDLNNFLKIVDESYLNFQDDYNKLERILELSSKESFKELNNFKNAIDSAAHVSLTDAKANIISANKNFCEVSGFTLPELIGKNHNIVNSGIHPISFFEEMWSKIVAGRIWQGEICNRKKNGELFWVDSTIIPFLNDKGKPYQYLSIRFDISNRKKIEEEIKTLALVAQKTQNVVIITDANGIAIWANDGFERITGYKTSELVGLKPGQLLQGKDTNLDTIKEISSCIKSQILFNGELLNYSKSGEPYWISISITPIIENDKHIGFIAIEADITEKKKFEVILKENDKLLRAINNASMELLANSDFNIAASKAMDIIGNAFEAQKVWIFKNDKNDFGEISTFSRIFDWYADGIQNQNNESDLQHLNYKEIGLESWRELLLQKKVIKENKNNFSISGKVKIFVEDLENIIVLPVNFLDTFWGFLAMGTQNPNYSWINSQEQILKNFASNIASAFERNESEVKLKENEEKFRLLIESATDIFYYTDPQGNFTYVNDISSVITGFSIEELLQKNFLDLVQPDYKKKVALFYKKQSTEGSLVTYYEFPITTKNGKTAWIGQNVQLINTGNSARGIQAIARDITKLKDAQTEITESHNFLNEIVESIPNPMFVKNRNHEWIMVNNAYTKLTGISKNKIIGQKDTAFIEKEQALSFIELDEKQFLDKKEMVREVVFSKKDGEEKTLLVKKTIFENKNESFLIGIITDITELKNSEKQILLHNKIADQISDAISVADYNGKIIYVNEAHAKNMNLSKDELIGSSVINREKLFESITSWQKHYNEIKFTGNQLIEGTNIRNDGSKFPVEANVKYVNIENKGYVVSAMRDITERKKAEEDVKNLKLFYENVLNKIPTDVVVFDKNHKYLFVNELAIKDREKRKWIIGHNDFEYATRYDKPLKMAESRRALFEEVITNKKQLEFEEKIISQEGNPHWMLRRFYPVMDDSNEVMTIIGFGIDITNRKVAEEKTKESEERLKLATSSANLGIWDWNLQTNKLIWDPSMYSIFGVDSNKFNNDYDAFESCLYDEDKERVAKEIKDAIDNNYDFKGLFRIVTDEGEIKYINAVSKTFRDTNEKPYRMIGVNFDVTESTIIQQKILKQQQDLEEAQRLAKVGAWEIDVKEKSIVWSKETFNICEVPLDKQPTLNETYGFFTPQTKEAVITAFFNSIEHHEEFELEAQLITSNKKIVDVKTRGIPYSEKGKVVSIRGIFQDITIEKEATRLMGQYTEELEKKNQELDKFAYVVSHDLKAPLRGINNLSMWIEEDMEGKLEPDTKNNLDLMRKRVKRMEGLIDGILQYSRAGRIKHEPTTFPLHEVLVELVNNLAPDEKFNINIHEDLPVMTTEKIVIEQIFSNYVSNALKYNKNPEPTIEISYQEKNGYYEFCVADNGAGIEKEFHEKVFVIFQTLQARDTYESTGVGLAIVKKMVEDKGGKVWIESEIGLGAKFYFSWPINE